MTADFINPEALHRPFSYTDVVEVTAGRPVYLAGQVALDRAGKLVGAGDIGAQTRQVLPAVREVRDTYVNTARPPASTAVEIRRLAVDGLLVEVEAVAVLAEDRDPDR